MKLINWLSMTVWETVVLYRTVVESLSTTVLHVFRTAFIRMIMLNVLWNYSWIQTFHKNEIDYYLSLYNDALKKDMFFVRALNATFQLGSHKDFKFSGTYNKYWQGTARDLYLFYFCFSYFMRVAGCHLHCRWEKSIASSPYWQPCINFVIHCVMCFTAWPMEYLLYIYTA